MNEPASSAPSGDEVVPVADDPSRFVDLSLFYFVHDTRGYVLWGEGLTHPQKVARAVAPG